MLWLLLACTEAPSGDDTGLPCSGEILQDTGTQYGDIEPECRCGEPTLQIGTGDLAFEPLEPGQDLTMIFGPQGGWHLLAAVQASNLRSIVSINARVVDVASERVVTDELDFLVQLVMESESCTGSYPNLYLVLETETEDEDDEDKPPQVLSCTTQRIEVCVSDTGGREVCSSIEVRAIPDDVDIENGNAEACD